MYKYPIMQNISSNFSNTTKDVFHPIRGHLRKRSELGTDINSKIEVLACYFKSSLQHDQSHNKG